MEWVCVRVCEIEGVRFYRPLVAVGDARRAGVVGAVVERVDGRLEPTARVGKDRHRVGHADLERLVPPLTAIAAHPRVREDAKRVGRIDALVARHVDARVVETAAAVLPPVRSAQAVVAAVANGGFERARAERHALDDVLGNVVVDGRRDGRADVGLPERAKAVARRRENLAVPQLARVAELATHLGAVDDPAAAASAAVVAGARGAPGGGVVVGVRLAEHRDAVGVVHAHGCLALGVAGADDLPEHRAADGYPAHWRRRRRRGRRGWRFRRQRRGRRRRRRPGRRRWWERRRGRRVGVEATRRAHVDDGERLERGVGKRRRRRRRRR